MPLKLAAAMLLLIGFPATADEDYVQILKIISAVESGWESADGAPFREHFLDFDGARYFESGGQNVGLTDLIEHHVEPEGDALSLDLEFTDPAVHVHGDFAYALVDTEVKAKVHESGREIHNKGFETFVLRKLDGVWRVVHTHSSGRPVKRD